MLAEAYGAEGYRVAKLEDLESTLRTAFASPNTAIIDVIVERDENVYPTVPSGASLDEYAVAVKTLGEGTLPRTVSLPCQGASPFPSLFSTVGRPLGRPFKSANAYWNGGCAEKP